MMLAEALRLLRTRQRLTQAAVSRLEGAPDFRTLSHWENKRKMPSVKLLQGYLTCLDLDFYDLQEALDQVEGRAPRRVRDGMKDLRQRVTALEQRHELEEVATEPAAEAAETTPGADPASGPR